VAVQSPLVPEPVLPVKSVLGRAALSHVNASAEGVPGGPSVSVPFAPRYHERALVPGSGKRPKDCSKAGTGRPAADPPAPLSNRIRTEGSASNAARAAA
jgi:hypothetical protein